MRQEAKRSQLATQAQFQEMKQSLTQEMKQSLIPVGLIYVQLPKEKTPSEIWPTMSWTDVSSSYPGLFFRVEGGDAASFGEVQEGDAPRLAGVGTGHCEDCDEGLNYQIELAATGQWSAWVHAAYKHGDGAHRDAFRFNITKAEVRPRNMAMRVWKRTG